MIVGQEKPDGGKLTVGADGEGRLRRSEPRRPGRRRTRSSRRSPAAPTTSCSASRRWRAGGTWPGSTSRGRTSRSWSASCSGGERNRIHLAKLLRSGGNLLLLDEPTNDLDVDTLRALEEALLNFGGCAVVISHDRWFLDRIATHILAFEGDSKVVWCEGNFQVYEEQRRARLGRRRRPAAPDQVPEAAPVRASVVMPSSVSRHVGGVTRFGVRRYVSADGTDGVVMDRSGRSTAYQVAERLSDAVWDGSMRGVAMTTTRTDGRAEAVASDGWSRVLAVRTSRGSRSNDRSRTTRGVPDRPVARPTEPRQ